MELAEEQKEVDKGEVRVVDNIRIRLLPVLDIMTAIIGKILAMYTLRGETFSPVAAKRIGRNMRHHLHQHFQNQENKIKDDLFANPRKWQDDVPGEGW